MKEKITITIDGQEFEANKRTFKSLKQGYGLYDKMNIGEDRFQISLNIIKIKK